MDNLLKKAPRDLTEGDRSRLVNLIEKAILDNGLKTPSQVRDFFSIKDHRYFQYRKIDLHSLMKEITPDTVRRKAKIFSKSDLIEMATKEILINKRFLTTKELGFLLDIPRSYFNKHGIDIAELSESLGYPRYRISGNWTASRKLSYLEKLTLKYKETILSLKRPVSITEFSNILKVDSRNLCKNLGGLERVIEIHSDCGYIYPSVETPFEKEYVISTCLDVIQERGTYLSKAEILRITGFPDRCFRQYIDSVVALNLKLGYVRNNRFFETSVFNSLKVIFKDEIITREKSFKGLVSPKGRLLRFDFYIESRNLIVEADGIQHYDPRSRFYSEYRVELDNLKNLYCEANSIKLVRIPYDPNISIDKILSVLPGTP